MVDEAAQAIEPSCWIPLLQGRRCVLAGDACQLAPTIMSREALDGGLSVSLMERAGALHDGLLSIMLNTQYRMHNAIALWASHEMYSDRLCSAPAVASHLLSDSPSVKVAQYIEILLSNVAFTGISWLSWISEKLKIHFCVVWKLTNAIIDWGRRVLVWFFTFRFCNPGRIIARLHPRSLFLSLLIYSLRVDPLLWISNLYFSGLFYHEGAYVAIGYTATIWKFDTWLRRTSGPSRDWIFLQ